MTKPPRSTYLFGTALATLAVIFPVAGHAVPPKAYLDQAQVYATGNKIQAFRIPTVNSDGKTKYYDLTINLNVLDNGKINTRKAKITTALSPNVNSNKFIQGTYVDANGIKCTLTTTVLPGGRSQAAMTCIAPNSASIQMTWVTGPIAGHPFELALKAAGIDKLTSQNDYSWGKIANEDGSNWWGCMNPNDLISATQIGKTLAIGGYRNGNQQACGVNMTKK